MKQFNIKIATELHLNQTVTHVSMFDFSCVTGQTFFYNLKAGKRIMRVGVSHSTILHSHVAAFTPDSERIYKEVIPSKSIPS
jgi:hypothetical protein